MYSELFQFLSETYLGWCCRALLAVDEGSGNEILERLKLSLNWGREIISVWVEETQKKRFLIECLITKIMKLQRANRTETYHKSQ